MMNEATAILDVDGTMGFTACGRSGGGAWGVELRPEVSNVEVRWLLAVLNSKFLWEWLHLEGDMKRGGWRGVDRGLLRLVQVPVPPPSVQKKAAALTERLETQVRDDARRPEATRLRKEIDLLVEKAFR